MEFSENDRTIEFYNRNAEGYFEETAGLDVDHLRAKFIKHLPKGGRILDAGCGSGRDTRAFQKMGFEVVAIDASKGMARQAREHLGIEVEVLRFEDIRFDSEFDGVWASASLLHLPDMALINGVRSLTQALRMDGVFYGSFKQGKREGWREGRYFRDMNKADLHALIREVDSLLLMETWETQNRRTELPEPVIWENFLAKRVRP